MRNEPLMKQNNLFFFRPKKKTPLYIQISSESRVATQALNINLKKGGKKRSCLLFTCTWQERRVIVLLITFYYSLQSFSLKSQRLAAPIGLSFRVCVCRTTIDRARPSPLYRTYNLTPNARFACHLSRLVQITRFDRPRRSAWRNFSNRHTRRARKDNAGE